MDTFDLQILRLVQADNRRSAADLGLEIGLSVSAVSDRLRRLNASGVIRANQAVVDPLRVGLSLCGFIFVDLEPRADEAGFAQALHGMPEVQEAHHITGPHSWLLKVRVRDTAALQHLLASQIKVLPGVLRSETMIVLDSAKDGAALALPVAPFGAAFAEGGA